VTFSIGFEIIFPLRSTIAITGAFFVPLPRLRGVPLFPPFLGFLGLLVLPVVNGNNYSLN